MTDEEIRDWRISEALDKLAPVFAAEDMTEQEIETKALFFGLPPAAMWTAHHLYKTVKGL